MSDCKGISEQELREITRAIVRRKIQRLISARDLLAPDWIARDVAEDLGFDPTDRTVAEVVDEQLRLTDYRWKIHTRTPAQSA